MKIASGANVSTVCAAKGQPMNRRCALKVGPLLLIAGLSVGDSVAEPASGIDDGRTVVASCPGGVRAVEKDRKIEITDADGRPTSPTLFEPMSQPPSCDKPFRVTRGGMWTFVAPSGRLLFDPPIFDSVYEFDDGYARVKQGQRWGIIDEAGRFLLAPKLDRILEGRNGLFRVEMEGRLVWITPTGEERPDPPAARGPLPHVLECGHGLRLVERAGNWGVVDSAGHDVIAARYRALICFKARGAWAAIDERHQWCVIGYNGELRDKPECTTTFYPSLGADAYPEPFAPDPYESSVLWTRAYLDFAQGRRATEPRFFGRGHLTRDRAGLSPGPCHIRQI